MLFPWSLDTQAWRWLNSHPAGTFTTWDALEAAFMKRYYSAARTSKLREAIMNFKQTPFESLHESWERYKDLLSQCPHHDIPSWMVIINFFNAVSEQHRNTLHAASGAKFESMSPDEVTELISNMASIASTYSQRDPSVRLLTRNDDFGGGRSKEHEEQNRKIEELTKELEKLKAKEENRNFKESNQTTHAVTQKHRSCDQCGGIGHESNLCPSFRAESCEGEQEEVNALQSYQGRNQGGFNGGWNQPMGNMPYKHATLNPPGFRPPSNGYYGNQGYDQGYGYGNQRSYGNYGGQGYDNNQGYGAYPPQPPMQPYGYPMQPQGPPYGYQAQGPPPQCHYFNQVGYPQQPQPSFQRVNEHGYYVQSPPRNSINDSDQPQPQGYAQPQQCMQPPSIAPLPLTYAKPLALPSIASPQVASPLPMDPQMFEIIKGMHAQIKGIQGEMALNQARPAITPARTILPAQGVQPRDQGPTHHAHAITSISGIGGEDPIVRMMQLVEESARDSVESKEVDEEFIVEDEPYEEEFSSNPKVKAKSWLPSSHDFVLERIDELVSHAELEVNPKKKENLIDEMNDSPQLSSSLTKDAAKDGKVEGEILEDSVETAKVHEGFVHVEGIEQKMSEMKGKSLGEDQAKKLKSKARVYTPPLPFPQRARQSREDDQQAKLVGTTKRSEISVPTLKTMAQTPNHANPPKHILKMKRNTEIRKLVSPTEGRDNISQTKMPKKLTDPGSFSIPCTIGDLSIDGALCDSGASVSILPLCIAKKFDMKSLSPTDMTIQLADRSTKHPLGILEDLPVKVGKLFIPTDFVVVDIPEDSRTPIILGRAFMATGGAKMNMQKGTLSFKVNGEKVKFRMPNTLKNPMVEDVFRFEKENVMMVSKVRDNVISKKVGESNVEALQGVNEESVEGQTSHKEDESSKIVVEPPPPDNEGVNDNEVGETSLLCLGDIVSDSKKSIAMVDGVKNVVFRGSEKEKKVKKKAKRSQTSKGNEWKEKRPRPCDGGWEEMTNIVKDVKATLSKILEKLCVYGPQRGGKENVGESRGYREGDPG